MDNIKVIYKKTIDKITSPASFLIIFTACMMMMTYSITTTRNIKNDKITREAKQDSLMSSISNEIRMLRAGISQDNTRRWNVIGISKWIEQLRPTLSTDECNRYAIAIVNESEIQKNVPIEMIVSVVRQESYFRSDVESDAGAVGLMGIMDMTAKWICGVTGIAYNGKKTLKNPEINIKIGTWFLSYLMIEYDNNHSLVLAHYNGGIRQKNRYLKRKKFKNVKEYKLSTDEISTRIEGIKDSLLNTGITDYKISEHHEYRYLRDVLAAKRLSPQTEKYIPEVIARMKKIQNFLSDPSVFSQPES